MTTIEQIKSWGKDHGSSLGGKQTLLFNEQLEISIVGGRAGLYGDFENDFELAIIDRKDRNFVTRFFVEGLQDDVLAYASGEEIEKIVNEVFHKQDFQVR
jgi:hypothetical protein